MVFNNTGNYVKSGVGITDIGATFNNSGSVIVNAGRLSLNSDNDIDSYSTGSFAIANGATLSFRQEWPQLRYRDTGQRQIQWHGSVAHRRCQRLSPLCADDWRQQPRRPTDGCQRRLQTDGSFTVANLSQTGGVLSGIGTLTVSGPTTLQGGAQIGTGTSQFNGAVAINGNASRVVGNGRTMNTPAVTTWGGNSSRCGQLDLRQQQRHLQQRRHLERHQQFQRLAGLSQLGRQRHRGLQQHRQLQQVRQRRQRHLHRVQQHRCGQRQRRSARAARQQQQHQHRFVPDRCGQHAEFRQECQQRRAGHAGQRHLQRHRRAAGGRVQHRRLGRAHARHQQPRLYAHHCQRHAANRRQLHRRQLQPNRRPTRGHRHAERSAGWPRSLAATRPTRAPASSTATWPSAATARAACPVGAR